MSTLSSVVEILGQSDSCIVLGVFEEDQEALISVNGKTKVVRPLGKDSHALPSDILFDGCFACQPKEQGAHHGIIADLFLDDEYQASI